MSIVPRATRLCMLGVAIATLAACQAQTAKVEHMDKPPLVVDPAGAPPARGVSAQPGQMVDSQADAAPAAEVGACEASKAQAMVGKPATPALVEQIRVATGATGVRTLKPGMMVTMDFREDRVNVEVDAKNVILSVRCG